MSERISRLMDGEVDEVEFHEIYAELKANGAFETWACYHVIGDHLRGAGGEASAIASRVAAALAKEPTVLAPPASAAARAGNSGRFAWAVAATLAAVTVVGWTAFSMLDVPPNAIAKAREATSVRAAAVQPKSDVPPDYLLAHQEYSPATAIQGVSPYLRAVAATEAPRQ